MQSHGKYYLRQQSATGVCLRTGRRNENQRKLKGEHAHRDVHSALIPFSQSKQVYSGVMQTRTKIKAPDKHTPLRLLPTAEKDQTLSLIQVTAQWRLSCRL